MKNYWLPLWLSFVIVIEVFGLIPLSIYLGNSNEFSTSFSSIANVYLTPALILLSVLFLLSVLLNPRMRKIYTAILSAIALLIWLQSFILIWDYGILNGSSIEWELSSLRSWFDLLLWVCILTLAVIFRKNIQSNSWKLVSGIALLQSITLLYSYSQINDVKQFSKSSKDFNQTKSEIHDFSAQQNVLHLMLDGFQSDVFNELINHPDFGQRYRGDLAGFVYFDEAISSFPYTRFSIASFIGGNIYQNDMPKDQFNESVFSNDNIFNTAHSFGYELDHVTDEYWARFHAKAKHENILTISNNRNDFLTSNAAKLFDLSLFRLSPHVVKKFIYNDQKWLVGSSFIQEEKMQYPYFYHSLFMHEMIENMSSNRTNPVYKYIHILNTHNPMVTNEDCSYSGEVLQTTRETLTIQSKCTLDIVTSLFNKMKELNIYDNTLIVMHADHGGWVTPYKYKKDVVNSLLDKPLPRAFPGPASPLLAIKPIGATEPLHNSSALVSLSDIPTTISKLMNWNKTFGDESTFIISESSEQRQRKFYHYTWQLDAWTTDYIGPLNEYIITGSHYDTPWVLNKTILPADDVNDSDN